MPNFHASLCKMRGMDIRLKEILNQNKIWHRFHAVTFMEFCAKWGAWK